MLPTNFMLLCFLEPELLHIILFQCGNRDCSYDLDLDLGQMTFIYILDPYSLEIYRMRKYELVCQGFRKTDIQTGKQTDTTEIIHHAVSRVVNDAYSWKLCRPNK